MGRILCALILASIAISATAQVLNEKGEEVNPYYISFDTPLPATVEDLRGEYLHISYNDRLGQSKSIKLGVYNSKRELLRELSLVKQFGQNYFNIGLEEHGLTFIENESYICRLVNENFEIQERLIRYLPKPVNSITASIIVNARQLSCNAKKGTGNLVEFYGQVNGGKAPYKANWYILNAHRTDFLYQPAHIVVPVPGLTSSIQVDKSPEYYVLLQITDACGNEQIATVQIVCERNEKQVNTLFFEKLSDVLSKVEFSK